MSLVDLIRVCTFSGTAIVGGMMLLGVMMLAQKPEPRLELVSMPAVAAQLPVPSNEAVPVIVAKVQVASAQPTSR